MMMMIMMKRTGGCSVVVAGVILQRGSSVSLARDIIETGTPAQVYLSHRIYSETALDWYVVLLRTYWGQKIHTFHGYYVSDGIRTK